MIMAKATDVCAKCNSDRIIPRARVVDRGHYNGAGDLNVAVYGNPDALLFKEMHEGNVSARVCGECGFTEFYASNPAELYATFTQSKGETG